MEFMEMKSIRTVDDKIDQKTGLPVFSFILSPSTKRKMLSQIDSLVIDLQDVGVRCYTYISCMKYVTCLDSVEVVVLDRPNPLGGIKMAGPSMDKSCMSYVVLFKFLLSME